MSQRRLAVLGIVGVLLIVVVAGGFWIIASSSVWRGSSSVWQGSGTRSRHSKWRF